MKARVLIIIVCMSLFGIGANAGNSILSELEKKYGYVVDHESSGYYKVGRGKPGVCDRNGNVVLAPGQYDDVLPVWHVPITQWLRVKQNGLMGVYDVRSGRLLIPILYKDVDWDYDDLYFEAKTEQSCAIYSQEGKLLVEGPYSGIRWYQVKREGYCEVYKHYQVDGKRESKVGVIDKTGKLIVPVEYQSTYISVRDKVIEVTQNKMRGAYDFHENQILPCVFDKIATYTYKDYGVFDVTQNGKHGLWKVNKEVVPSLYDDIRCWTFKKGYCMAKKDGYWGVIDTVGKELLPCLYDTIMESDSYFCLSKKGKFGYIDHQTYEEVIPFKYDIASPFVKGVARVNYKGNWELLSDPRKVISAQPIATPKGKKKAVSTFPAPNSEVDTDIPETKRNEENTFAYIIANENYEIAKVPYALNDGWIFEQYCRKTLGIPEKNIHLYEDATAGNIIACIENLKETARAYEGDAEIIFYYAGHAFPDEEEHSAYLLPIDGNSQNIATAYSLKRLYKEFNSVPIKKLVCFIDACFSGTTRTDEMLIAGRGVAVTVKDDVPLGNAIVFTSATGAETAHSYEEKRHGMYTYYLLQKLQETQGEVSLEELTNYVRKMVRRKSVVVNEKMQTPTVISSPTIGAEWKNWTLK